MLEPFGPAILIAALVFGVAVGIGVWTRPSPAPGFWASLALWWVQLVAAAFAVFWVGFLGISTPHCSPECEWDLLGNNFQVFMWAMAVVQLASLALIVLLRRHRRVSIVPIAAIALIVVLCAVSSAVAYKAMLFF